MSEKAFLIIQTLQWVLNIIEQERDINKIREKIMMIREEILNKGAEYFIYQILSQL